MLTVVVPVYNEERALPAFLAQVDRWDGVEVVFSDGGSTDATLGLLEGRCVVRGPKGRGGQCNRGAARAQGDVLLFLHVDELLDPRAFGQIANAVAGGARWGCLTLRWDRRGPVYRFGAWLSNLRAGVGGVPFGDQGLFFERAFFDEVGGFPDLPLMEDYELSRSLKARGLRPRQLRAWVQASARRFEEGGALRTALAMWHLRHLYRWGADPAELARLYRDVREGGSRG